MNNNIEVTYTMIGGLMIRNVPESAKKIKILSSGDIISINEFGLERFIKSDSGSVSEDYNKYSFVVFDVPPRAPVYGLIGNELHQLPLNENCGGPIENGKTYIVGEQGLPHEAIQAFGRGKRVSEKKEPSINILTLSFEAGSKLSDVINMVESEIQNSGCSVTDNISSISINEFKKDISSIIKDKIYQTSQEIANCAQDDEYDSSQVVLLINKLNKLESLMRKITHGGDIRLSVIS